MSWLSVAWHWYSEEMKLTTGAISHPHAELVNPIVASLGAAGLIGAAIWQARTATQRHYAQTKADQQRRITESFSKAVEQLGDAKREVRLGGIYSLERISKESPDDYWTVMETLTAFVREHARWTEPAPLASETLAGAVENRTNNPGARPTTDIAAILTVLKRRKPDGRRREEENKWRIDLSGTDLRGADIAGIHLEGALLGGVNWEGAHLPESFLQGAQLFKAHLEGACLMGVHFEGAFLGNAHLQRAQLGGAHFDEHSGLTDARFQLADLVGANLQGVLF
ncbi:MAG: pentapeptide repeat-containing protein, partial [Acetobacteraceae bacterium]|nr:pentapeptide repeat-containing protein [Acetobacteraceae bacterium]